jgi:hypothetical protein
MKKKYYLFLLVMSELGDTGENRVWTEEFAAPY